MISIVEIAKAMFSLIEEQLIDDVVTRAEQSRVSYISQTEEFRTLNANLQTYLVDIKTIDDENRQLEEGIDQIRTNYISTLENHLKRLPDDFRQHSQTLTEAHLERYRFKSRARRFVTEREESKRRINFLASNEKEQTKRLNILQRQERSVRNEFNKLNEQMQSLLNYVENEKQTHRQAMDKVDDLQVQLERTCVERSKTEFEIQTLKEEVKLMQTAREFLHEERETIIATQTEANEYFLSRLTESISRIRGDFDDLNKSQLKQTENEYKQMLQILEESFLSSETNDETTQQRQIQTELEQLHDEQQLSLQELTTLDEHNQILSERASAMETNLYALRDERMRELTSKDTELHRSKIELQALNEKLNHLAEYDRNLKFELTLYRGVLESEYRRKQAPMNTAHLIRPTTLRTNKNSLTDRTTWLTSSTKQSKSNDQQQEEILTTRDRVQSEYDPLGEDTNVPIDDALSTKTLSDIEKFLDEETSWRKLIEPFSQEQKTEKIVTDEPSSASSSVVSKEDQLIQQSISPTLTTGDETQQSPISSPPPIHREDQSIPSEAQQLPTISSSNQRTPVPFEIHQSPPTSPQEGQTLSGVQQTSSRTSSITKETPSEEQQPSTLPITPSVIEDRSVSPQTRQLPTTSTQEHQPPSRTSSINTEISSETQKSPSTTTVPTVSEVQPSTTPPKEDQPPSHTSSITTEPSSDIQKSPSTATTPAVSEVQLPTSDVFQSPSKPPEEDQASSRTSSINTEPSSDVQRSPSALTTPAVSEAQLPTTDVLQSPSTSFKEDQASSRTSPITTEPSSNNEKSPFAETASEIQLTASDVPRSPSKPSEEDQASSRTSSITTEPSSDIQKTPSTATTATTSEVQISASDAPQSSANPSEEDQTSSRTSLINMESSSDVQGSPSAPTTPTASEVQLPTTDVPQSSSTPFKEDQASSRTSSITTEPSSDIQKSPFAETASEIQLTALDVPRSPSKPSEEDQASSRTSSITTGPLSDIQKTPYTATTATTSEVQLPASDAPQSFSKPSEEDQTLSRTSSINIETSSDTQKVSPSATTSTVSEHQLPSADIPQSPSTSSEEYQPSSRTSSVNTEIAFDIQRLSSSAATPTVVEIQPVFPLVGQLPSTSPQEHASSRTSSTSAEISPSLTTAPKSFEHQSPITPTGDHLTSSEVQKSPIVDAPTATADVHNKSLPVVTSRGQTSITVFGGETDDNIKHEESTLRVTNELDKSVDSIEPSSTEEFEVPLDSKPNESRSSSFPLTNTSQEERKPSLSESDTNISATQTNKLVLIQDTSHREEESSSSLSNVTEENISTDKISSTTTNDDGNFVELNPLLLRDLSKQSSYSTSLTDIEEMDSLPYRKFETKFDEDDDPLITVIMQDLRYVFHELANIDDLVEINNDLPDKLLEHLNLRDHPIKTLFDSLLRKYLVQAAAQGNRSGTLDLAEFCDILFPILTSRCTERHIRKLFDLLDTSNYGYLSLQEITELLEVLQANHTIDLAQHIIDEYDTDHDGKLNVDELIEAITRTNETSEHILSEQTENQTISIQVPTIIYPPKIDEKLSRGILLLAGIFKQVGAHSDSKLLDSSKKNLLTEITDEFIDIGINISNDDLQLFVQLFLDNKQNTDLFISWMEFRDAFLPIANDGSYSKSNIKQWFEIFDTNQTGAITREQVIQLVRLLQIQEPEEVVNKLNATIERQTNDNSSWTLDELTFALNNVDETAAHLLTDNEQISSFDTNWLSNTIF